MLRSEFAINLEAIKFSIEAKCLSKNKFNEITFYCTYFFLNQNIGENMA